MIYRSLFIISLFVTAIVFCSRTIKSIPYESHQKYFGEAEQVGCSRLNPGFPSRTTFHRVSPAGGLYKSFQKAKIPPNDLNELITASRTIAYPNPAGGGSEFLVEWLDDSNANPCMIIVKTLKVDEKTLLVFEKENQKAWTAKVIEFDSNMKSDYF